MVVCSRSLWPNSIWMLRRSAPASSRCVAKQCLSVCGCTSFWRPARWAASLQASQTTLVSIAAGRLGSSRHLAGDCRSLLARLSGPMWRHYARSLESEHRLAKVIGQMVGAAQQDGEAIARSIFREIFFRYGRVPLEPVGPRHFLKPLPQFPVYGFPCLANVFVRRNGGLGLVGIRDEGDIELVMKAISQPQQRQHRVMHRREMSPQVKQPVSARRYFPQHLLGRESSKKLVRPVELCLPYLQSESHIRAFVCHSFISSTLRQVRRVETQVIGG